MRDEPGPAGTTGSLGQGRNERCLLLLLPTSVPVRFLAPKRPPAAVMSPLLPSPIPPRLIHPPADG